MDKEGRKSEENTDSIENAFNSEATSKENRYTGRNLQLPDNKVRSQRSCNMPEPRGKKQPIILAYRSWYRVSKKALPGVWHFL